MRLPTRRKVEKKQRAALLRDAVWFCRRNGFYVFFFSEDPAPACVHVNAFYPLSTTVNRVCHKDFWVHDISGKLTKGTAWRFNPPARYIVLCFNIHGWSIQPMRGCCECVCEQGMFLPCSRLCRFNTHPRQTESIQWQTKC